MWTRNKSRKQALINAMKHRGGIALCSAAAVLCQSGKTFRFKLV